MPQNKPLVSVAIVTYNQKDFLHECIDSILMQDYPNIEIVIADDGSTDGSQDILLAYQKAHPDKFTLELSKKNLGITKNHNLAQFRCNGKYIAWIGGDDVMLPGKISKQVAFMEADPNCTISYHNLDVFLSSTNETLFLINNHQNAKEGTFEQVVQYGCFNGGCGTMVRSDKTPIKGFDDRLPIASDWLYWMESLANGGTIRYIDEVLGRYRRHNNNVTSQSNYNAYIDHLSSCNILLASHPHLYKQILTIYSENLRALRRKEEKNYANWLKASILVNFNIKAIIAYILYFVSLKKIEK